MKKLLSTILFISITLFASAYDFMVDGLCYNINSDSTSVMVTYQNFDYTTNPKYLNLCEDLIIPEYVTYKGKTYSVTKIGDFAFAGCSGLTQITFSNSVTEIGIGAFRNCSGLTHVAFPNSLTKIGAWAFSDCSGLTQVNFNSVKNIGGYAFICCSGLTQVTIPNSVTAIGDGAFAACNGLIQVYIPNSVKYFGCLAFTKCSNLTQVTIPKSLATDKAKMKLCFGDFKGTIKIND